MRYGIRSITMDEIARHLAISKKTLYQYFADKDEIVYEVARMHVQEECKQWQMVKEQPSAFYEALVFLHCMKRDFEQLNPAVIFDLTRFYPRAYTVIEEMKAQVIKPEFVRHLQRGIKEGLFREDLNVEILARLNTSLFELAANPSIFPPSQYRITEVAVTIYENFLLGILSEEGHKLWYQMKQSGQLQKTMQEIAAGLSPNFDQQVPESEA